MKKKILIGSIGAVFIIILATLTSVVGMQGTETSVKKEVPLFIIRTQEATESETKIMTKSEYVGKDASSKTYIPVLDSTNFLLERFIDRIHRMSDVEFERFVSLAISNNILDNNNPKETKILLGYVRNNPDVLRMSADHAPTLHTFFDCPTSMFNWIPGCGIYCLIKLFVNPLCFFLSGGALYTLP